MAFDHSPRLIRSAATFTSPASFATYHFTLEIPDDAGEPLKAVTIEQRENFLEVVKFKENKSGAFLGDSCAGGTELMLDAVGGSAEPGSVTVVFEEPVAPGKTVTITVKPKRNPSHSGVYLFGITAYPDGEDSLGSYLGSGRISIYD
ncbi:MAG: DUF2808 domain-containing protein [Okeania sp. SIO2D1]|nr:DUF2808 domain-containing protein [Okeania sp. SIO2D1]